MAIYRIISGKLVDNGRTYQPGDTFEWTGDLPVHWRTKALIVAADPPPPEPPSGLMVQAFSGGWYQILKGNGEPLSTKRVRRPVAVQLVGEDVVSAAEAFKADEE